LPEFCRFCRIVIKSAPACYVYEDAKTMAFLSITPINEGHTLVVPKIHCENIFEILDEEASHLVKTVKKVALAVKNGVKAEGIKIVQNNGSAAGQVVFHLHVHVIPEYMGRKTELLRGTRQIKELEEVARKIRHYISNSRLKPGNC
jgi:histidine triad (HIT) family protein